jgi:redox-sensitive bicupin YhaK (pirin superfamily)
MSARDIAARRKAAARGLARAVTLPPPGPGFIGEGHGHSRDRRAEFARNDPFIMLADDRVDLPPGQRAGGPHPHAGFEILTFAVEGEARDRDEGLLRAGDVLWMTAGSGVVHNEDLEPLGKVRILQLWVTLPSASRWAAPRFEHVPRGDAPVRQEPGVEARVYGIVGAITSPSHTSPVTVVDIRLAPNAVFEQEVLRHRGFLSLQGRVRWADSRRRTFLLVRSAGWSSAVRQQRFV